MFVWLLRYNLYNSVSSLQSRKSQESDTTAEQGGLPCLRPGYNFAGVANQYLLSYPTMTLVQTSFYDIDTHNSHLTFDVPNKYGFVGPEIFADNTQDK